MIDTSSTANAEFSLFGTAAGRQPPPSSSCGMERANINFNPNSIVIQRPLPTETYSWSDFPIAVEEETEYSYSYNNNCNYNNNAYNNNNCSMQSDSSICSLSSASTSSSSSTLSASSSTESMRSMSKRSQPQSSSGLSPSAASLQQPRRNVRFSSSLEVRTYSLVLGDHPMCDDGLAIELGWEYDEIDGKRVDLHIHEDCKQLSMDMLSSSSSPSSAAAAAARGNNTNISFNNITNYCFRRSYLQRKQLLLDVAGCTKAELDQRTKSLGDERLRINRLRQQEQLEEQYS